MNNIFSQWSYINESKINIIRILQEVNLKINQLKMTQPSNSGQASPGTIQISNSTINGPVIFNENGNSLHVGTILILKMLSQTQGQNAIKKKM